jgi:hypothetical protein
MPVGGAEEFQSRRGLQGMDNIHIGPNFKAHGFTVINK